MMAVAVTLIALIAITAVFDDGYASSLDVDMLI
jgi:hypothetical protein